MSAIARKGEKFAEFRKRRQQPPITERIVCDLRAVLTIMPSLLRTGAPVLSRPLRCGVPAPFISTRAHGAGLRHVSLRWRCGSARVKLAAVMGDGSFGFTWRTRDDRTSEFLLMVVIQRQALIKSDRNRVLTAVIFPWTSAAPIMPVSPRRLE
jgi:hypothetical protein